MVMMSSGLKDSLSYKIDEKTYQEFPDKWEKRIKEEGLSNKFILINKEPELWVFLGEHGDHLLLSKNDSAIYCSCKGFRMEIEKKTNKGCTHIYALKIAKKFNKFRDISEKINNQELNKIIEEIMELDYSSYLRTILIKFS